MTFRVGDRTLDVLEFLLHNCGAKAVDIMEGLELSQSNTSTRLLFLRRHGWAECVGHRYYITTRGIFLLMAYKRVELGEYLKKLEEARKELERIVGLYRIVEKFVDESLIAMKKVDEENKARIGKIVEEIIGHEVGVMSRKR